MSSERGPAVGEWYKNSDGVSFEVVAVDPEEKRVEIHYFDGAMEALDLERWQGLQVTSRKPPDWSLPLTGIRLEVFGRREEKRAIREWSGPLDLME